MKATNETQTRAPEAEANDSANLDHAPRKLTFAENVILTMKVLAIAGLLIATLWGMNLWTTAD